MHELVWLIKLFEQNIKSLQYCIINQWIKIIISVVIKKHEQTLYMNNSEGTFIYLAWYSCMMKSLNNESYQFLCLIRQLKGVSRTMSLLVLYCFVHKYNVKLQNGTNNIKHFSVYYAYLKPFRKFSADMQNYSLILMNDIERTWFIMEIMYLT